jgi:BarA-like signal transduction histidine kinase
MSKILLIGNDLRLQMTRSAVLARTPATVVYCNAIEAARSLQTDCFDMVVLCHSLTERQTLEITKMTHDKLPTATVLRVVSHISQEMPHSVTAFDATGPSDPEGLIRRTAELLRHPPSSTIPSQSGG